MDGSGSESRFDDGKAEDAFRTIGEVADALGIRRHVLRYWEDQFPMLRPVKRSGGRRYYRPDDVRLVEIIDRLVHHEGYTLRGARLAIEAQSDRLSIPTTKVSKTATPNGQTPPAAPDLAIALRNLRAELVTALEQC